LNRTLPAAVSLGQRGELAAAQYLKSRGYRIVAGGFRQRFGEVDLIALDGRTVVFVEVKTRSSLRGGPPVDAVDRHKQRRITATALSFLKRRRLLECRIRFDVVGIVWVDHSQPPEIVHYENAFHSDSFGQFYS
jgi:putative endonuclease